MKNTMIWASEEICVASVQAEKQIHLASCLDKLMTEVQRNLEPKNRDRFTQVCVILIHMFPKTLHCQAHQSWQLF